MDFFTQKDLDIVVEYAGQDVSTNKHNELKSVYEKLEYFLQLLQLKGFSYEIRKDPRKQHGRGKFVFQDYLWSRVYPKEFVKDSKGKFGYIVGANDGVIVFHIMGIKEFQNHEASLFAHNSCYTKININGLDYDKLVERFIDFDKQYRELYISTGAKLGIKKFQKYLEKNRMESIVNLLKSKKQIILQGAPGTGKTYLAKKIAHQLVGNGIDSISAQDIKKYIYKGLTINNCSQRGTYIIRDITEKNVIIGGEGIEDKNVSFNKIQEAYSNTKWEAGKITNGLDSYEAAIAKYIFNNNIDKDSRIKLVQFHPSYTYEDFVRGIEVKTENGQPEYITKNKILGKFAEEALKNWEDSKKQPDVLSKEKWVENHLKTFKEELQEKLENGEIIELKEGNKPTLTAIEEDAFRCNRYNNPQDSVLMKDKDIIYGYIGLYMDNSILKIKDNQNLSKSARSGMYYLYQNLINLFKKYLEDKNISYTYSKINGLSLSEDNYVIIIDEINRANLPAVLGELIYALEYRGEKVESMYAIDGDKGLILPPNLYIIGTMNTADRSVGQIDYAIRRRFAFVDMIPKSLAGEVDGFEERLFKKVSELFIKDYDEYTRTNKIVASNYISDEFRPEDIWIGHSYFIMKDKEGNDIMEMRLKYEIVPILKEYVKDGIFKEAKVVEKKISELFPS